jgi:hypothetical protein
MPEIAMQLTTATQGNFKTIVKPLSFSPQSLSFSSPITHPFLFHHACKLKIQSGAGRVMPIYNLHRTRDEISRLLAIESVHNENNESLPLHCSKFQNNTSERQLHDNVCNDSKLNATRAPGNRNARKTALYSICLPQYFPYAYGHP